MVAFKSQEFTIKSAGSQRQRCRMTRYAMVIDRHLRRLQCLWQPARWKTRLPVWEKQVAHLRSRQ